MKKNFKFLSSLALAGILSTSVIGGATLAVTTDVKTEPVGIYSQLIANKKVVPFVLANKDDIVTIKDIKNSGKFDNMTLFNNSAIPSEDTVVKTGDTFVANGEEYTAVIYGDVDCDGTISMLDALAIQDYRHGKVTLNELQSMAANVIWKDGSEIDMIDALRIQTYRNEIDNTLVDGVPDAEEEPEVTYSITLSVNDNGYINVENRNATKIGVKLSETSEEVTNLKFKVLNANGEEVTVSGLTTTTVAEHTDYKEISVDFSSIPEGKYTIQVLDEEGKTVLGTINTEINYTLPAVAQVKTERTSTTEATLSLNAMGDSDIVKIYYVVADVAPNGFDGEKFTWASDADKVDTKTMNVSNSKIENAVIANELTTNKAYKVYYVVENTYGNQTAIANADILSDTVNTQIEKVKEITAPVLEENDTTFTWEAVNGANGYIVTLMKDGKIVAEEDVTDPEYTVAINGAGKYQISVIAKGDNTTSKNSEATVSPEIEVVALNSVTDIAFEMTPEGKSMLSWKDDNNKDNVKEYKVTLYTLNDKGEYILAQELTATEAKQEINMTANTVYKAEVVVVAKDDQAKLVNAEKDTLEGFYKIEANANIDSATENAVTLTLNDVKVNGKSATYQVNVYAVREDNNPEVPELTFVTTKNVEFKDGKIVVDGLESNKTYAFKLIADVDGVKGESDYIRQATTLRKTPEINNLKVVKSEKEAIEGTIYKNGDAMIIDGEKHDLTLNYSSAFKNIANVIDHLHANDIVTISGDTVTLNLPSEATDSSAKLDLGTAVKDMTVIIESNEFEKQIKTTTGSEAKEVILKGEGSRFDVSELNSKKISLTNNVTVTGNKQYTVNANTTATINGVKVSTEKETVITATGKALNVTANKETNNLVFENLLADNIDEIKAKITFIGSEDLTDKQLGTITIKTTGGKVTVEQQNVNVSSELNVEVNSGEVVIQNEAFTGDKNITVTNKEEGTTTINAIANTKAPISMTSVELKEYTDEEFEKAFPGITNPEEIAKIKEYINSFGINGKGAKITVNKDDDKVTIVFSKAVENVNILNIK